MEAKINKLIGRCYELLFFVTPLLMYHKTSELFEFNKILFIYTITFCVGALWVYKMIATGKFILKRTPFDLFLGFFLSAQVLSFLFSIDKHTSFYGYYGRFNGGLLSTFCYIILFYGFVTHIDNFGHSAAVFIQKLLKLSIFSSTIVMLWGLTGKLGHDLTCFIFTGSLNNACWTTQFNPVERMFSTIGQPNWLGAYLAVCFFFGLYFFLKERKPMYTAYLVLTFASILFTRSRSALLSVVGLSLILGGAFFYAYKNEKKPLKKRISFLVVLFAVSVLLFKTGIPTIDSFITSAKPAEKVAVATQAGTESFEIRKIVWDGALKLGIKHPVLGTGPETFAYAYYFTRPLKHNVTSEWDFIYNRAHNEFLNYFATTGVIGFTTYIVLIGFTYFFALKYLYKRKTHDYTSVLVGLLLVAYATIHITNFFGFSTTTISLFFFLIPAFIVVLIRGEANVVEISFTELQKKRAQFVSLLLLLFGAVFVTSYLLADINYATGDNYQKIQEYDKARIYLERALSLRREPVYQDKISGVYANLAFENSYDTSAQNDETNKQTTELIHLSEKNSDQALASSPYNVMYWKTRAKNLYLFYQVTQNVDYFNLADKAVDAAQALAPTDPKIFYTRAVFYLARYENEEGKNKESARSLLNDRGLKSINRAIEFKNDYRDAYYVRGLILKKLGRTGEAHAVFEYMLKKFGPDDDVKRELGGTL